MNHGPTLQSGSTGDDVRRLQRLFVMMKTLGPSEIDGDFGPKTAAAVRDFQSGAGLTADAIVGPLTWAKLPADPNTPVIRSGAHGAVVTALQKALRTFGGPGAPTDPGAADGIFGPQTEAAVKAYQSGHGLSADGVVGDRTWWAPAGGAGATLASLAGLTTV
jgi:peptidoglycan hydrolase-like protein with peptidoglycan-binding domain